MSLKNSISQGKGSCECCHEMGGLHEANCAYLKGYFDAQIAHRPKNFIGLWIHYFYNVSLWLLYVGVLLAGTAGPVEAIRRGLVVTLPGKLAMGLIVICTLVAAISAMLALDGVNREGPREYSKYY